MHSLTSLEHLPPTNRFRKLDLRCTSLASLAPLSYVSRLMDLNLFSCIGLPPSALAPLSLCAALKQLDII
jgi:hypothetical protein